MHPAEPGDVYLDDAVLGWLSRVGLLAPDPEHLHASVCPDPAGSGCPGTTLARSASGVPLCGNGVWHPAGEDRDDAR